MRLQSLIGQRFGKLVVLARAPVTTRYAKWICQCDCGGTATPTGSALKAGLTISCGCFARAKTRERNLARPRGTGTRPTSVKSLIGQRFGKLVVLEQAPMTGHHAQWISQCDCGGRAVSASHTLKSGKATSCGCVNRAITAARNLTHGAYVNPEMKRVLSIWRNMLARCRDPKSRYYGGVGITVCERWHEFENFFADMGQPPDGMSIDRINSAGNYEPDNCRWATRTEQGRNRASVHRITIDGASVTVSEACERFNINSKAVKVRVIYYAKHPRKPAITHAEAFNAVLGQRIAS